jgi:ribokinase
VSGRVLVLGSVNLDIVISAARLPGAGETVLGGELQRHPGGKGANQAVAAARAGASVAMIGAVGDDVEGRIGLDALRAEGVDLVAVLTKPGASGVAIIAVDPAGQNQIVVAPGTNARMSASDVQEAVAALSPNASDVLLASLEVPMEAVVRGVELASAAGAAIIVNPAPAARLPSSILHAGPILTPNRAELVRLSGADGIAAGAQRLLSNGARAVLVTLGDQGCLLVDDSGQTSIPGRHVEVVRDTTGAGDTFSGVLAAWLCDGASLVAAARAANAAAALSVRAGGAREGMPLRRDVEAFLRGG